MKKLNPIIAALNVVLVLFLFISGCAPKITAPSTSNEGTSSNTDNAYKGDQKIISIKAGTFYSLILTEKGEVYAWGGNDFGHLYSDLKDVKESPVPLKIPLDEKIVAIEAGKDPVALTDKGEVYTWGIKRTSHEPIIETDKTLVLEKLDIPQKVSKLCKGALAITESGSLYAWGWNYQGQVGNGTTEYVQKPVKVSLPKKVVSASGFGTHSLALLEDGSVYAWGSNYFGEIGNGEEVPKPKPNSELLENPVPTPERVKLNKKVKFISTGDGASYAVTQDNEIYSWGTNDSGQLGVKKEIASTSTPIKIDLRGDFQAIEAGGHHVLVVTNDNKIYSWGKNNGGCVIGNGSNEEIIYEPSLVSIPEKISQISSGTGFSYVMTAEGNIWGWGYNVLYRFFTNNQKVPIPIRIEI